LILTRYAISAGGGVGTGVGPAGFARMVAVTTVGAVVTFVVSGVYSSTHPAEIRKASTRRREKYSLMRCNSPRWTKKLSFLGAGDFSAQSSPVEDLQSSKNFVLEKKVVHVLS
jgi:hypothetical protein